MGIVLPDKCPETLAWYLRELIKWNRKINLIGPAGEKEIIDKHFLDSLALVPFLDEIKGSELLDLGTGAGFPGLVIKTVRPELALLLVEARMKKVAFLRHVIRNLKLRKVETMAVHLERSPSPAMASSHPLIISRAFASVISFLDLVEGYSPPGGKVLCMKGPRAEAELEEWERTRPNSPFTLEHINHYRLPFSGSERVLVIFSKSE